MNTTQPGTSHTIVRLFQPGKFYVNLKGRDLEIASDKNMPPTFDRTMTEVTEPKITEPETIFDPQAGDMNLTILEHCKKY